MLVVTHYIEIVKVVTRMPPKKSRRIRVKVRIKKKIRA